MHQSQLVAVVGGSGAGKTWLAHELERRFRGKAIRLSLDDFYRDRSHLPERWRGRVNFDHPRAIDWDELQRVLADFAAGRKTWVPVYSFATHCRKGRKRFKPARVIIMDGLWLLRRPAIRRLFQWRVYVDCPSRVRLQRRIKRDVAERGRTEASTRQQFFRNVAPMHKRFVAPQARWANVRFRECPTSDAIQELVGKIRTGGRL